MSGLLAFLLGSVLGSTHRVETRAVLKEYDRRKQNNN